MAGEEDRSLRGELEQAYSVHKGFSLDDLVVFVTSECFAVPLNIAAGEAFVAGHMDRAGLGWGIGVPLAVLGFTFHWWKRLIPASTLGSIQWVARYGWFVALLLAFGYVVGPDVYRRATINAPIQAGFTQQDVDAKISSALANVNSQLSQVTQQRDAAQAALAKANKPIPPPTPPHLTDSQGLVSWEENVGSCRTNYTQICGLIVTGKNNSNSNIKFTSAQAISVNGDVVDLKIELGSEGRIPATEAKIPPGAIFQLWIEFSPFIEAQELLAKWGRAHFNAEYQGVKFSRAFDEEKMREMLGPSTFSPRPTRDKHGN